HAHAAASDKQAHALRDWGARNARRQARTGLGQAAGGPRTPDCNAGRDHASVVFGNGRDRESTECGRYERIASCCTRERIVVRAAQSTDRGNRGISRHDTHCSAALVIVPRTDLRAFGIDAPCEQAVARDKGVGSLLLAVLEQQVAAVAVVVTLYDTRVDHRLEDERLTRLEPVHAHPAELLLFPGTRMRRRERSSVCAGTHQPPRANALR